MVFILQYISPPEPTMRKRKNHWLRGNVRGGQQVDWFLEEETGGTNRGPPSGEERYRNLGFSCRLSLILPTRNQFRLTVPCGGKTLSTFPFSCWCSVGSYLSRFPPIQFLSLWPGEMEEEIDQWTRGKRRKWITICIFFHGLSSATATGEKEFAKKKEEQIANSLFSPGELSQEKKTKRMEPKSACQGKGFWFLFFY